MQVSKQISTKRGSAGSESNLEVGQSTLTPGQLLLDAPHHQTKPAGETKKQARQAPLINQLFAYADNDVGEGNETKRTATKRRAETNRALKRITHRNETHNETNKSSSMKSLLCGLEYGTFVLYCLQQKSNSDSTIASYRKREESQY